MVAVGELVANGLKFLRGMANDMWTIRGCKEQECKTGDGDAVECRCEKVEAEEGLGEAVY